MLDWQVFALANMLSRIDLLMIACFHEIRLPVVE